MSLKQQLDKMGATPGKLALIGVLVLVLVMVIVKQLPKSAPASASTASEVATQQPTEANVSNPTSLLTVDSKKENKSPLWPEIDLTETLANDPFAPPSWVAQEERAAIATNNDPGDLAELQEQGASIVVISQAGQGGKATKSATIGEQKLHIGDILEGYRVTDITTQGIFLNKLDPR